MRTTFSACRGGPCQEHPSGWAILSLQENYIGEFHVVLDEWTASLTYGAEVDTPQTRLLVAAFLASLAGE